MWLGAFVITNRSCPNGICGEAGFVFLPLFIPPFIATVAVIVIDITRLFKRLTPVKYSPRISWLVPTLCIGVPILGLIFVSFFSFQKDHYSFQKAVDVIVNCRASALGGYGSNLYIYLKTDPASEIKVTGGESARTALINAARDNARACGYDLSRFELPIN